MSHITYLLFLSIVWSEFESHSHKLEKKSVVSQRFLRVDINDYELSNFIVVTNNNVKMSNKP